MWDSHFLFKFPSFTEIFQYYIIRLRNTDSSTFLQYLFTRTNNVKQANFKKVFCTNSVKYFGVAWIDTKYMDVFDNISTWELLLEKNVAKDTFKKVEYWKFQLNCFTLAWTNMGNRNGELLKIFIYKNHAKKWNY